MRPARACKGGLLLSFPLAVAALSWAGCGEGDDAMPQATADANGGDAGATDSGKDDAAPPITPKGSRVLGLDIATDDPAYYDNVQFARDAAAISSSTVRLTWDTIERPADGGADAEAGATDVFFAGLHVFGLVLSSTGVGAAVTIDVLDANGFRGPSDLAASPLDSSAVAERFDRVTDYALDQLHDVNVTALFLATDVDRVFGDDPKPYAALASLVGHVATHVHSTYPSVPVGVVVSYDVVEAKKELLTPVWNASNVIGIRYMPSSTATKPTTDLTGVVFTVTAGKPIFLAAGYPSAGPSGPADQAAFVHDLFSAWDVLGTNIRHVTFFELDDAPPDVAAARAAAQGHANDPSFTARVGSYGLRDTAHRPKAAFTTFAAEAHARGF